MMIVDFPDAARPRMRLNTARLRLRLLAALGACALPALPAATTADDRPQASFAASAFTQAENQGAGVLPVTLNAAAPVAGSARYRAVNGAAVAGEDFVLASGILRFPPGGDRAGIPLSVIDNNINAPDKSFTVELFDPMGLVLAAPTVATVAIRDDDEVTLSIVGGATLTEGDGRRAEFTLSADRPSAVDLTARLHVAETGRLLARVPGETPSETSVRLPAGDYSATYTAPAIQDDRLDEADAAITATLLPSSADLPAVYRYRVAAAPASSAAVAVHDNDPPVAIRIEPPARAVMEAPDAALIYTATLDKASAKTVAVTYQTRDAVFSQTSHGASHAAALAGRDYLPVGGTLTFPPAETGPLSITVSIIDDAIAEPEEEILALRFTAPRNAVFAAGRGPLSLTAAIADNDGDPTLTVADIEVHEAEDLIFTARLSHASRRTASAVYRTINASAGADDFTAIPDTELRFLPGETVKRITVTAHDDALDERDETMRLYLFAPVNLVLTDPSSGADGYLAAVGAIRHDPSDAPPTPTPELSIAAVAADITGGEPAKFLIRSDHAPLSELVFFVDIEVDAAEVLAAPPTSPTRLTLAAGRRVGAFRIATAASAAYSPPADIRVALAPRAGYTVDSAANAATVTVRDDMPPPRYTLHAFDAVEGEDLRFTFTVSEPLSEDTVFRHFAVGYADHSGSGGAPVGGETAPGDEDFAAKKKPACANHQSGSFTVRRGETRGSFRLCARDDDYLEARRETFTMHVLPDMESDSPATIQERSLASATAAIVDNERLPLRLQRVSLARPDLALPPSATTITEGQARAVAFALAPGGDALPVEDLTVRLQVSETGAALAAEPPPTVVVPWRRALPNGGRPAWVYTYFLTDDATDEPDSVITAQLLPGPGYETAGAPIRVTVRDNDPALSLSAPPSVEEGDEIRFTVTAAAPAQRDAVVPLEWQDDADLISGAPPAAVTVRAGQTRAAFTIATVETDVFDSGRLERGAITARLGATPDTAVSGYALTQAAATVTVREDDIPAVSVISRTPAAITEGDEIVLFFSADRFNAATDYTVHVRMEQGAGDYFAAPPPTAVTILRNTREVVLRLPTVADYLHEPEGALKATILPGDAYRPAADAAGVAIAIRDDRIAYVPLPTLGLYPTATHGDSRHPSHTCLPENTRISFRLQADYTDAPDTETDTRLTVAVAYEQSGDFLAADNPTAFTVNRVGDKAAATHAFSLADDTAHEAHGFVALRLLGSYYYNFGGEGARSTLRWRVCDNDQPAVSIASRGADIGEGALAQFDIRLSRATYKALRIPLRLEHAGRFLDSALTATTITVAAGRDYAYYAIATVDDSLAEPSDRLSATLSDGDDWDLDQASATLDIHDRGSLAADLPEIYFAAPAVRVAEGEAATLEVRLSSPLATALTVRYGARDGAAEAGADYAPIVDTGRGRPDGRARAALIFKPGGEGLLRFAAGETAQEIAVRAYEDNLNEAPETFSLILYDPHDGSHHAAAGAGAAAGADAASCDAEDCAAALFGPRGAQVLRRGEAVVTIVDTDKPVLNVSAGPQVTERDGARAVFTISADMRPQQPLPVRFRLRQQGRTLADSALTDSEQAEDAFVMTRVLPAGQHLWQLSFAIENDSRDETDAAVALALLADGDSGYTKGRHSSATVTVFDDDEPPRIAVAGDAVTEETDLRFAVTLDRPSDKTVAVTYHTADGAAASAIAAAVAGEDYSPAVGVLTFLPGRTALTVTVQAIDDRHLDAVQEVLSLRLSAPRNGVFDGGTAIGTIIDNDILIGIAADAAAIQEGESAVFTISAMHEVLRTLAVNIGVSGVGVRHLAAPPASPVILPAGESAVRYTVQTRHRAAFPEPPYGDLEAAILPGDHYVADPDAAAARTRVHDNPPILVRGEAAPATVIEGGSVVFTINLSRQPVPGEIAAIDYRAELFDLPGFAGRDDLSGALSGTWTFRHGDPTRVSATVATRNDGLGENVETFALRLENPRNVILPAEPYQIVAAIADNDLPAVSVFADADGVVEEGRPATFTLLAAPAPSAPLTARVAVSQHGDAIAGAPPTAVTIAAAAANAALTVRTEDDRRGEMAATITATLLPGEGYSVAPARAQAGIVVADNDGGPAAEEIPQIRIAAPVAAVAEGEPAVFQLIADTTPTAMLPVAVEVSQSGAFFAAAGAAATVATATFAAGRSATLLSIATVPDMLDEEHGLVSARLSPVDATSRYTIGEPAAAEIAVRDDDEPPLLSIHNMPVVTEDQGAELAFVLRLSEVSAKTVGVTYATAEPNSGAAATPQQTAAGAPQAAGADYTAVSGRLAFPPGERDAVVTVPILGDDFSEADEILLLRLSAARHARFPGGGDSHDGTGLIRDNEGATRLSVTDARVAEGAGHAEFLVRLSPAAVAAVEVNYATFNGTAVAGTDHADYMATRGALTFLPGATAATVRVSIHDDGVNEPPEERFLLRVTGRVAAMPAQAGSEQDSIGARIATGAIVDNDMPTLTLSTAQATPTPEYGIERLAFTVRADIPPYQALTVNLTVTETGAMLAQPAPPTALFSGLAQTYRYDIDQDEVVEADSVVTARLAPGDGYRISEPRAFTITITDDDALPVARVDLADPMAVHAAAESVGYIDYPYIVTGVPHTAPIRFDWRIEPRETAAGIPARAGRDLRETAGTVVIPVGQTAATARARFSDAVIADRYRQADGGGRHFTFHTMSPVNAALSQGVRGQAIPSAILDDDTAPRPGFGIRPQAAATTEGQTARFEIHTGGHALLQAFTVSTRVRAVGVDLLSGAREEIVPVVLQAGSDSAGLRVVTVDNEVKRAAFITAELAADDFFYQLRPPVAATVTITDNDDAPEVFVADVAAAESEDLKFAVALSAAAAVETRVHYQTAAADTSAATAGRDYTAVSGTLTFAVGERGMTVRVPVHDDAADEADETVSFRLSLPADSTAKILARGVAVGAILDNDTPTLRLSAADVTEAAGASAVFTLHADPSPYRDLTVAFQAAPSRGGLISAALASAENVLAVAHEDNAIRGLFRLAAGQSAAPFAVPIVNDERDLGDGAITLTLPAPRDTARAGYAVAAAPAARAAVAIFEDDNAPPILSPVAAVALEGEPLVFAVYLNPPSGKTVSVSYQTLPAAAGAAAVAGEDYLPRSGLLRFLPGAVAQHVTVHTRDDARDEADEEYFRLRLANPRHAVFDDVGGAADGAIRDNDAPPRLAAFSPAAAEDQNLVFTVTLAAASGRLAGVHYQTVDGAARAADGDYLALPLSELRFRPGETRKEITVTVLNDSRDEPNEPLFLRFSSPNNLLLGDAGAEPGTNQSMEVSGTILHDRADTAGLRLPELSLAVDRSPIVEGSTATFTLRAAAPPEGEIVADIGVEPSAGLSFLAQTPPPSIRIGAGSRGAKYAFRTDDDDDFELPGEIVIYLRPGDGYTINPRATRATVRVLDNDPQPDYALGDEHALEGRDFAFALILREPAREDSEFTWAALATGLSDPAPASAADFGGALPGGTFTVAARAHTGVFTVRAADDALIEPAETFRVEVRDAAGIRRALATGTIIDNDFPAVSLERISPAIVSEGPAAELAFAVTAVPAAVEDLTVRLTVSESGDALVAARALRAVIPAGQTRTEHRWYLVDDQVDEATSIVAAGIATPIAATVTGTALSGDRYRLGDAISAVAHVMDNDPLVQLQGPARVLEGDTLVYTALADAPAYRPIALEVFWNQTNDLLPAVRPTAVTLPAGAARARFSVALLNTEVWDKSVLLRGYVTARIAAREATAARDAAPTQDAAAYRLGDTEATTRVDEDDTVWVWVQPRSNDTITEGDQARFTILGSVARPNAEIYVQLAIAESGGEFTPDPLPRQAVILRNTTEAVVTIPTDDDRLDEPDGGITVTVLPGNGYRPIAEEVEAMPGRPAMRRSATIAIQDDDGAAAGSHEVRFAAAGRPADGGCLSEGQTALYEVSATYLGGDIPGALPINVSITSSGGGAGGGASADFLPADTPSRITLLTGRVTDLRERITVRRRFLVPTVDDRVDEPDGVITIRALGGEGYHVAADADTLVYPHCDNDTPRLEVSAATASVAEGRPARFRIAADIAPYQYLYLPATLAYDGGFADRYVRSETLRFERGGLALTVTVATTDDATREEGGSVRLTVADGDGWDLGMASAVARIVDAGSAIADGDPVFHIEDATTDERGDLAFPVRLSAAVATGASAAAVAEARVQYSTADIEAEAGTDYRATSGALVFAPGVSARVVRVPVYDDSVAEGDERLSLSLFNVQGAAEAGARMTATGTIRDNDTPLLTIAKAGDATEGEGAAARFIVASAVVARDDVVARLRVTQTGDYLAVAPGATAVTLQAGRSQAEYAAPLKNDDLVGPGGSVTASLAAGDGYAIGVPAAATALVFDDDAAPLLTVADASAAENDAAGLVFALTIAPPLRQSASVAYQSIDGTAAAGADYLPVGDTLTFPAGATGRLLTVALVDDKEIEFDRETLRLAFTGARGLSLGDGGLAARGVIVDDDASPLYAIAAVEEAVVEGQAARFAVAVTGAAPNLPTSVAMTITERGNYIAAADAGARRVVVPAGMTAATLTIATIGDELDDDPQGSVTATLVPPTGDEAYRLFPSRESAVARALDDEVLTVSLAAVAAPGDADGDPLTVVEGGVFGLEVRSDLAPWSDDNGRVCLQVTRLSETGLSDTGDSELCPVIPAGETVAAAVAPIPRDGEADGGYEMRVALRPPTAEANYRLGAATALTYTVADDDRDDDGRRDADDPDDDGGDEDDSDDDKPDDDGGDDDKGDDDAAPPPVLTAAAATAAEDADLVFLLTLSAPSTQTVAVSYRTADGTATAGADYEPLDARLTFLPGESERRLTARVHDDELLENDETLSLLLHAPTRLALAADSALGLIEDNDKPTLSIAAAPTAITEGETAVFTIRAAFVAADDAAFSPMTVRLSMTESGDYLAADTVLPAAMTMSAGETVMRLTIVTEDDDRIESPGAVAAALLPAAEYLSGGQASAAVTIRDNDGLDKEDARRINKAALPQVAAAVADHTVRAVRERMQAMLEGGGAAGMQLQGAPLERFLAGQAARQAERDGGGPGLASRARAPHPQPRLGPGDVAFHLSLSGEERPQTLGLWGRGYHSDLSSQKPLSLDGAVSGAMLGVDSLRGDSLFGMALNYARAAVDFRREDGLAGRHETRLAGIHPYFGRRLGKGGRLWGALGYDDGEVEITAERLPEARHAFDIRMTTAALGGYGPLFELVAAEGATRIGFVGDGVYSHVEESGVADGIAAHTGRLRAGLKLDYTRALSLPGLGPAVGAVIDGGAAADGRLGGKFEMTWRRDFGDALSGNGMELGGALEVALPGLGLRLDLGGRALLAHEDALREWGIGGGFSWARREDGRGPSLAFRPRWGVVAAGGRQLWDKGLGEEGLGDGFAAGHRAGGRYELEFKYGVPVTLLRGSFLRGLRGGEVLSLFARDEMEHDHHDLGFGVDLTLDVTPGATLRAGYEAALPSRGGHPDLGAIPDHRAFIRYRMGF